MTTDKPDLPPTAPAYAPPQPGTAVGPAVGAHPRRRPSRMLPNLLLTSAAVVVLTPVALGLLVYGSGVRYVRTLQMLDEAPVVATLLVVVGLVLLLAVAVIGAWAPLAPMVSGLLWGIVPGLVMAADPRLVFSSSDDYLGLQMAQYLSQSGALGVPLVVGVLLLGGGLAAAFARRSGWNAAARA